ncbi:Rieske 2Fe-2S domain-containing protein [Actinomycetospora corticicola]|uniref:Nitrite reductase/ring-hydroxylating ferredoxin subunit n=1 Tax=Actinomycetospora corticicola TaxID=663602 RepID=A0A7Y9DRC5_9PSEU|nr:nitrite reductase/ring-hydroxylating ferredoxin subunit [Actinomycetospora corticicola]
MRIAVMGADELAPGEHRVVQVGRRSIGIFRVGDRYHALADHCPHQGGPLCRGRVAPVAVAPAPGEVALDPDRVFVACPWHGWEYDVTTGRSYVGPGDAPARSFPAEVVAVDPRTGRVPGPYVADTFDVSVENHVVVVDTTARPRPDDVQEDPA